MLEISRVKIPLKRSDFRVLDRHDHKILELYFISSKGDNTCTKDNKLCNKMVVQPGKGVEYM